jgi:hypothetical protein
MQWLFETLSLFGRAVSDLISDPPRTWPGQAPGPGPGLRPTSAWPDDQHQPGQASPLQLTAHARVTHAPVF